MRKLSDKQFVLICCCMQAISFMLADFYNPLLPDIQQYFLVPIHLAKDVTALNLLGLGIGQIVFGVLSDRFGRRRMLLCGNFLAFACNSIAFFSPNIYFLLIMRVLTGVGAGAIPVTSRALLKDRFEKTTLLKANASLSMAITISLAIAPFLGGILGEYVNWHFAFAISSCFALAMFIFGFFLLPETLQQPHSIQFKTLLNAAKTVVTSRTLIACALISALSVLMLIFYLIQSTFIFRNNYGFSAIGVGVVYGLSAFFSIFGARFVKKHSHWGPYRLIRFALVSSLITTVLGNIILQFIDSPYVLIFVVFVIYFNLGLLMPSIGTLTVNSASSHIGLTLALLGFTRMFSSGVFSSLLARFIYPSLAACMLSLLAICLLRLIAYYLLLSRPKQAR
jgi:multidrug resistance protein